jgi:hypothetical protein
VRVGRRKGVMVSYEEEDTTTRVPCPTSLLAVLGSASKKKKRKSQIE